MANKNAALFWILCLTVVIHLSCGNEHSSEAVSAGYELETREVNVYPVNHTLLEEHLPLDIEIASIGFDSLFSRATNSEEIRFSGWFSITDVVLQEVTKSGYNSCIIEVACFSDGKRKMSFKENLIRNSDIPRELYTSNIFMGKDDRKIQFDFPYRRLQLRPGEQNVVFKIEVYPANFQGDSSGYGKYMSIAKEPIAWKNLSVNVAAPNLYEVNVEILKIELDTSMIDQNKFDVRFLGNGYPDLFWKLTCGNEEIFSSPERKNALSYTRRYSSGNFIGCGEDLVTLEILDHDQTSHHDLVEKYEIDISRLRRESGQVDTIQFGVVKEMIYKVNVAPQNFD